VCGTVDVNVDILMEKTEYESCEKDAPHVIMFWEVLREMTPQERTLFLRFVWGRSRLPAGRNFKRFKITPLSKGSNVDNYLPVSHTCFFQLDLPAYSTKQIMHDKLVYAITHCQAIDLDRVATEAFGEDV
jgi:E3 ubiquitin-protein ligase HERC2